jgi:catechol 2,3-dioxygenase-like lactoylglutathione lyase family enzyme
MAGEKTFDGITFRIRHTMMLVRDLDRSIEFYTRLLGMDVQRIRWRRRKTSASGI